MRYAFARRFDRPVKGIGADDECNTKTAAVITGGICLVFGFVAGIMFLGAIDH